MASLFKNGLKGLSDSLHSGVAGSVHRIVGIDFRSKPGLIQVHQKLAKNSGSTVDELCKVNVPASDGSTIWFSSTSGKIWREVAGVWTLVYTLVITAFDFITAVYAEKSISVASKATSPVVFFRDNGAKMFVCGWLTTSVHEYALSTAWDVSTATFTQSYDATTEIDTATGFAMSSDGTKMYILNTDNDTIYQYTLSAWTLSGAAYSTKSFSVGSETSVGTSIAFKSDGTKLYVLGDSGSGIAYQYTLGTPWDISTAGYDSVSFSFSTGVQANGFGFNNDGSKVFICASGSSPKIFQHSLGTPWDISTIVYDDKFIYANGGSLSLPPLSIFFKADGRSFYVGFVNAGLVKQYSMGDGTEEVKTLGASEFRDLSANSTESFEQYIYWATQYYVHRIPVANLGNTWSQYVTPVGRFENGDTEFHPMVVANNVLYMGDNKVIASSESGVFTAETNFNILEPERITTLSNFDTDVLVGTKFENQNKARVLRWDTFSLSWSAEDILEETAINAFIKDDNFVYASAGKYGRLYFYNGEKLEPYKRIPGEWGSTTNATVYPNATGFLLGVPIFGLSNVSGNPALQGVYGLGSFSKDYAKTLSLDFPISSGSFSGVTIGSILVKDSDLYVSWQDGSNVGVDKIDWSNKYASAYIETMTLHGGDDRSKFKTLARVWADYVSLPTDTNIEFSYKKRYEANFADLTAVKDDKLMQVRTDKGTVSEVLNLQLRFDFVVSNNDAPEIENFGMDQVVAKKGI